MKVPERDFQEAVIGLAKLHGWHVAHFRACHTDKGWRTPMQGDVGFPDLVLARDGTVLFAELKSEKGILTASQKDWQRELGDCYVWRPDDMDKINSLLRRTRVHHAPDRTE